MIDILSPYSSKMKTLLDKHADDMLKQTYAIPYPKAMSFLAYNYVLLYGLQLQLQDDETFTQAQLLSILRAMTVKNCSGDAVPASITPGSIAVTCRCSSLAPDYFTGASIILDPMSGDYLKWIHTQYAGNTTFMLLLDGTRALTPYVEFDYLPEGGVKFTGFAPQAANIFVALP